MIRISELKLKIGEPEEHLKEKICKRLRLDQNQELSYTIFKKSLDARKKEDIHFHYIVDVQVDKEKKLLHTLKGKDISITPDLSYHFPKGEVVLEKPPVVVGFGPGGMFAGLLLAQMGLKPMILERGERIDKRTKTVEDFWQGKGLNINSNVQFGEGGAGAFSDGKLTTRIKDLRCRKVLEELVLAGAPKEILYDSKPHIGTDRLKVVVQKIRETIEELGGKVCFESQMTDIGIEKGRVTSVIVNGTEKIETNHVVLAIGHSARDTFALLAEKGIALEQKPFAVGVRIEHPQEAINQVQYGKEAAKLKAADYKLTYQASNGRSVYTFCMCPGGYVVAAASEEKRLAVNGMSEYARDGKNANSALLVQVSPEDFPDDSPLAGVAFQRELEEKAFIAGGKNYFAPVETVGEFLSLEQKEEKGLFPTYRPGTTRATMEEIFPTFVLEALREAIPVMGRRLKGFDRPDAILTAVESRSSSPVRIVRNEKGESCSLLGLYPTGEGAGYAGGIISAAVDGILAAEHIFCNPQIEKK